MFVESLDFKQLEKHHVDNRHHVTQLNDKIPNFLNYNPGPVFEAIFSDKALG